jgi:TPR repeat protein
MAVAFKAIVGSALLALSFSAPAMAGPFEDGVTAYDRNDYSTAMRHWRPLADQGNPAAQSNLALMYFKGQGVSKDLAQAYMWASLSAARGHQEGVKNRDSIAKGMTPTQVADAQKRAGAWKPTGQPAQAPAQASATAQTPTQSTSRPATTTTTTIIRR